MACRIMADVERVDGSRERDLEQPHDAFRDGAIGFAGLNGEGLLPDLGGRHGQGREAGDGVDQQVDECRECGEGVDSGDHLPYLTCTLRKSIRRRWWWIWTSWSATWRAWPRTRASTSCACGRTPRRTSRCGWHGGSSRWARRG